MADIKKLGFIPTDNIKKLQKHIKDTKNMNSIVNKMEEIIKCKMEIEELRRRINKISECHECNEIISNLNNMERQIDQIVYHIAGFIGTLEAMAIVLGVTRERIRQIESGAIKKLKHPTNRHIFNDIKEIVGYINYTSESQYIDIKGGRNNDWD